VIYPIPPLKEYWGGREKGSGDKSDFTGKTLIHGEINEVTAPPDPSIIQLKA